MEIKLKKKVKFGYLLVSIVFGVYFLTGSKIIEVLAFLIFTTIVIWHFKTNKLTSLDENVK